MRYGISTRLRFASLVLLTLTGTWLGHAAEYGITAGWRGVELGLVGPAHSYMLPVAAVLVVAAFLLGVRLARLAQLARLHVARLWRELRRGVRATGPAPGTPVGPREAHPIGLFLAVALAQIALYLLQENVEALTAGLPAPGAGAIAGAHWTAPLVQLGAASCLTLVWVALGRLLFRPSAERTRLEAVIRAIRRRRRAVPQAAPEPLTPASTWSPLARQARPPPRLIAA